MYSQREHSSTRSRGQRSSEGPTSADLLDQMNQINQTISTMIADGINQMLAPTLTGLRTPGAAREEPRRKSHRHDDCCDCPDCGRDECYCRCCIGDADLVIYARLFELRVIPITLVNERRREKPIRLELSQFRTRGGDTLGVVAAILPPTEFVLPPCGEEQILIILETFPNPEQPDPVPNPVPAPAPVPGSGIERMRAALDDRQRLPDVDECRVLYADLRVEGCDIRPVRIALALLPRDCDEYVIECGCSCC